MSPDADTTLAIEAVRSHWGRTKAVVAPLSDNSFNRFFRVDDGDDRFALRLGALVRVHVDGTEGLEAAWLDQLRADGWSVPVVVECAEVSGRLFTLFTWTRGRPIKQRSVNAAPERLGALMAQLHLQAAAAPRIVNQELVRSDRVTYLPAHDLVSEYSPLCRDALERAQAAIAELWADPPHEPHLLHGDIGTHNVMTWRNQLTPIDFQDLQFGFQQQDIGITLADFDRGRTGWSIRFLDGYARVASLPHIPDELRSALRAARSLNIINLGMHPRWSGLDGILARHLPIVEAWMRGDN